MAQGDRRKHKGFGGIAGHDDPADGWQDGHPPSPAHAADHADAGQCGDAACATRHTSAHPIGVPYPYSSYPTPHAYTRYATPYPDPTSDPAPQPYSDYTCANPYSSTNGQFSHHPSIYIFRNKRAP